MSRLSPQVFSHPTLDIARKLLGTKLVRRWKGKRLSGFIVECEAYIGPRDSACHASRGKTARNQVMFGPAGRAYVYFTYGIHWMLNVVTGREGFPAAVLIRALEPLEGLGTMRFLREREGRKVADRDLTSGPARLTQATAIEGKLNGEDLIWGKELWLEKGEKVPSSLVQRGPRIGISYALEKDRQRKWRFWIRGSAYTSR
jgi:DNA-3-methyladenine glycosylase